MAIAARISFSQRQPRLKSRASLSASIPTSAWTSYWREVEAKAGYVAFRGAPAHRIHGAFRDKPHFRTGEMPYIQRPLFRRRSCTSLQCQL